MINISRVTVHQCSYEVKDKKEMEKLRKEIATAFETGISNIQFTYEDRGEVIRETRNRDPEQ